MEATKVCEVNTSTTIEDKICIAADKLEKLMYSTGEYEYPVEKQICWISNTPNQNRDEVFNKICDSIAISSEQLKRYLEYQIETLGKLGLKDAVEQAASIKEDFAEIENMQEAEETIDEVIERVNARLDAHYEKFKDTVDTVFENYMKLQEGIKGIPQALTEAKDAFLNDVKKIYTSLKEGVNETLTKIKESSFAQGLKQTKDNIVEKFHSGVEKSEKFKNCFKTFMGEIKEAVVHLSENIKTSPLKEQNLSNNIENAPSEIQNSSEIIKKRNVFLRIGDQISSQLKDAADGLEYGINTVEKKVLTLCRNTLEKGQNLAEKQIEKSDQKLKEIDSRTEKDIKKTARVAVERD